MDVLMDDLPALDQEESEQEYHRNPHSNTGHHTDMYPGAGKVYGTGETFTQKFNRDQYADWRVHNIYYPFSSRPDWQLGAWLLHSRLSMEAIDEFLWLDLVRYFTSFISDL